MKKQSAKRIANQFLHYAKENTSDKEVSPLGFCEELSERYWPLTKKECLQIFMEAFNRWPSNSELKEMRPDSERHARLYLEEEAQSFNNHYGSDNW